MDKSEIRMKILEMCFKQKDGVIDLSTAKRLWRWVETGIDPHESTVIGVDLSDTFNRADKNILRNG